MTGDEKPPMDVDRYITDEAVQAAVDAAWNPGWPELLTDPTARRALRVVLPGILAQHETDMLRQRDLFAAAAGYDLGFADGKAAAGELDSPEQEIG